MNCPSCAAELPPQATICGACGHLIEDPLVGATLNDRYRIQAKLASGGFGSIYRAVQANNNRKVAIKVMHRELSEDANLVARFRREAVALCSLRDSHTVTTYELDETADGRLFIVMELLEGKNLLEVFRSTGPLPWRRMLKIARQVCSALAEAHAQGIVHRDLKPANIFLEEGRGPGDSVKVLDFGIAKIMHGSEIDDGTELTVTGQAVGTLEYMAPEQLMGGACDARTDMYTLGVVVYEVIVGRRPFASASVLDLLSTQLAQKAPKPSLYVPLPGAVTDIMLRCLERDAAARYRDVTELAAAIDAVLAQSDMELLATRTSTARGVAAPKVALPRRVQSGPISYLPPGGGTATPPAGTPVTPAPPAGFEAPPARRLVDESAAAAPTLAAGDASYPAMPAPPGAMPAPLRGREASVPVRPPPPARLSPLRITLLMLVLAGVGVGAGVLISQLGI